MDGALLSLLRRQLGRLSASGHPPEFSAVLGLHRQRAQKSSDLTFKALHRVCNPAEISDGIASVTSVSAKLPKNVNTLQMQGNLEMFFWKRLGFFCPQPSF